MARITLRQLLDHAAETRLRRARLQHQQYGAGAGHHGGGRRHRRARHHPGLARRALLRQRHHAQAHDGCGHRDLSAHPGLRASRPRQRARHLHDRDPGRLHLGDDGRLAQGRRQDARPTGTTMSASPGPSPRWPISAASRSKANSACSARWKPARARRKTATASRASSRHDQLLTNPDEAVKFVAETKVDALAIAMGTSHGAYKFTRKPDGAILAMNVIEEIHQKLPNMHLVMHGSSSVPQDLQDIINQYGGKMKPDLGRAGRGDPARHQARRPQDQHRHRQPHGDDRPDPQDPRRRTRANSIRANT